MGTLSTPGAAEAGLVVAAGTVVALAAAARSTWSPCGLSMLSTITPLGERSRGHSYRATAAWFVVGVTAGGATLGLLMALGAEAVRVSGMPADSRLLALGLAALVALVSDTGLLGRRLPVHRRQVNERWLDEYRPWVYGGGFGWQIGTGLATYVTSAAVYLLVVAGALSALPLAALALGTLFGFLRGLAVLLTSRVRSTDDLLGLHRRVEAALPTAERGLRASELLVLLVVAVALAGPLAAFVLAAAGAGAAAVAALSRRDRPGRSRPAAAPGSAGVAGHAGRAEPPVCHVDGGDQVAGSGRIGDGRRLA